MVERTFNILTTVKMTEEQDAELNKLVEDVLAADTDGEVDYIAISTASIDDGVLCDTVTPIVSGKAFASCDLEDKVSFRNTIDFTRNDMLPPSVLILWHREGM